VPTYLTTKVIFLVVVPNLSVFKFGTRAVSPLGNFMNSVTVEFLAKPSTSGLTGCFSLTVSLVELKWVVNLTSGALGLKSCGICRNFRNGLRDSTYADARTNRFAAQVG
jgi:hypothetical protein